MKGTCSDPQTISSSKQGNLILSASVSLPVSLLSVVCLSWVLSWILSVLFIPLQLRFQKVRTSKGFYGCVLAVKGTGDSHSHIMLLVCLLSINTSMCLCRTRSNTELCQLQELYPHNVWIQFNYDFLRVFSHRSERRRPNLKGKMTTNVPHNLSRMHRTVFEKTNP